MALPKKKSRAITVNNEEYRYIISTGKYDENWSFNLNVTIQIAEGEGNVLKVEGLVTRDYWLDVPSDVTSKEDYPVLTPTDIVFMIEKGIREGWIPNKKGASFIIKLDKSFPQKYGIN